MKKRDVTCYVKKARLCEKEPGNSEDQRKLPAAQSYVEIDLLVDGIPVTIFHPVKTWLQYFRENES